MEGKVRFHAQTQLANAVALSEQQTETSDSVWEIGRGMKNVYDEVKGIGNRTESSFY